MKSAMISAPGACDVSLFRTEAKPPVGAVEGAYGYPVSTPDAPSTRLTAASSPLRTASRQTRSWMRKCASASLASHQRSSCDLCRRRRSSPNTRSRMNTNCARAARPAPAHGPAREASQARIRRFTSRTYACACGYTRALASECANSYARSAPGTASWSRRTVARSAPSRAARSCAKRWRAAAAAPYPASRPSNAFSTRESIPESVTEKPWFENPSVPRDAPSPYDADTVSKPYPARVSNARDIECAPPPPVLAFVCRIAAASMRAHVSAAPAAPSPDAAPAHASSAALSREGTGLACRRMSASRKDPGGP